MSRVEIGRGLVALSASVYASIGSAPAAHAVGIDCLPMRNSGQPSRFFLDNAAPKGRIIDATDVLIELNALRANPVLYITAVNQYKELFRSSRCFPGEGRYLVSSVEGEAPANEAIAVLRQQSPLRTLRSATILMRAARDLVFEQSRTGGTGHQSADGSGPGRRAMRNGGGIYVSEVIAYGANSPRAVIRQFLVDDGVPDRGHRMALFDGNARFAGVACGRHPIYRTMCVIDMASTPDGSLPSESHTHFLSLARHDGSDAYLDM